MIVEWEIKESETIPILKLLPELVEESRKEKGNISLKSDPDEPILCPSETS